MKSRAAILGARGGAYLEGPSGSCLRSDLISNGTDLEDILFMQDCVPQDGRDVAIYVERANYLVN